MSDNQHAGLMDAIYRPQAAIYDITRRYYLFGRDRLINGLDAGPGQHVLEIGCGTGRNLIKAAKAHGQAQFYGVDISNVMLATAEKSLKRHGFGKQVTLAQGDAQNFDPMACFGRDHFDRIFFSYSLTMIPVWQQALSHAFLHLAPGGKLSVVDFHTGAGMFGPARWLLHRWLDLFHVTPRDELPDVFAKLARKHEMDVHTNLLGKGYAILLSAQKPKGLKN